MEPLDSPARALGSSPQAPDAASHAFDPAPPASPPLEDELAHATVTTLEDAARVAEVLRERCRARVQGRDDVIDLALVALLSGGHVLLEDYPGSGKTTLAKTLGESILDDRGGDELPSFRRVQFTPDLLPSDITGVMVFDAASSTFHFRRGPLFAYVVLADEINRTSPKVQAALLEAMGERQVTVDDVTYPLDELFFVIATQNPLDLVGTYPLPVAQLDRFLFKVRMTHLERDAELEVLRRWERTPRPVELPRIGRSQVVAAQRVVYEGVHVHPAMHECLVDLARALRADARVLQGVSTRALVLAVPAMQARAMMRGRDFVSSEDLEALVVPLFQHRVQLAPGIDDAAEVVRECAAAPLEALARRSLQRRSI